MLHWDILGASRDHAWMSKHGCQDMAAKICKCTHLCAQSICIWNWLQSQWQIARIGLSFKAFAANVFGFLQGRQGKLFFCWLCFLGLLLWGFLLARSTGRWRWCCWARRVAVGRGWSLGCSLWWAHPYKRIQNITTHHTHRFHKWNHLTLTQR